MKWYRKDTLELLGLGSSFEILEKGDLPLSAEESVEKVFGPKENRGAMVISGIGGIVGSGKAMQFGSRLLPYDVPLVGLDLPGAPDGLGRQFQGLLRSFGPEKANAIMENIIKIHYDGKKLPSSLKQFRPAFLLEAIPEILSLKKEHYALFREAFPHIEIRSVTSGFPSSELGVPIAHPAFPHEINKVFEVVEEKPSPFTHLLWALGLIPLPVSDHYSFVLDVLFCGITLAGLRYHQRTNIPYWKLDKFIRRRLGPNPFRAHDAIGAKGANFLTWSCLHHLAQQYGPLFTPTENLINGKEYGQNWYPPNHFRPLVNWELPDEELFETYLLGPMVQMTALMMHEKRAHLAIMNAIGELCAQFSRGIVAEIRQMGVEKAIATVEKYHKELPGTEQNWYPQALEKIQSPEGQALYVNGAHNGKVGLITISRESYNWDVDQELNRVIDWLKQEGIERVILTGDFHMSTQMVGADTQEFFSALEDKEEGFRIAYSWSKTARRLNKEFHCSVGIIVGKRCLGGMLELMSHCHYLLAREDCQIGMPEVTLPVIPGMEGCHWPFRKAKSEDWSRLLQFILEGVPLPAKETRGWLVDEAAPLNKILPLAWNLASGEEVSLKPRKLEESSLNGFPSSPPPLSKAGETREKAREAIFQTIQKSCSLTLDEALEVQARMSGDFMSSSLCQKGVLGQNYSKTVQI